MKLNRLLNKPVKRIALVGNIAAGKTTLAQRLSVETSIPVTHVDTLQFDENLQIKNLAQTRHELDTIEQKNAWIIDGHGPLDMLENRFRRADQIIFIDRPLWRNYLWLTYRQIKNIFKPRSEFHGKKSELNWSHIKKIYTTTWKIHKKMRPELLRMLAREEFKDKTMVIGAKNAAQV